MMGQGWMRVRDYARQNGCTPQNIYKHLRTYAEQLEGHTSQGPGRKGVLLDDFAQEFLRGVMYPKEVAADDTITRLQAELDEARSALFAAMQEDMKHRTKIAQLEADNEKMSFELSANLKALAASNEERDAQAAELQQAVEEREKAAAELEQMRVEAQKRRQEAEEAEERKMYALEAQRAAEDARAATEAKLNALPRWQKWLIGWKGE